MEDSFCRLLHFDQFALREILYTRSAAAIQARCRKLGLGKRYVHWGPLEKQKLRKMYPEESRESICAAFPDRDWSSIRSAARRYKFRRKKKPYKITGIVANDQIRVRCYEIGWNMRDLDEESGTGRYFQTRGYRGKYPNFKAINRAVSTFGGFLSVHWRGEDED